MRKLVPYSVFLYCLMSNVDFTTILAKCIDTKCSDCYTSHSDTYPNLPILSLSLSISQVSEYVNKIHNTRPNTGFNRIFTYYQFWPSRNLQKLIRYGNPRCYLGNSITFQYASGNNWCFLQRHIHDFKKFLPVLYKALLW